jgi:hypothetical protein
MANYNLVINSTFQPFSYERYLQPLQVYDTAYKEVENTLADLNTKASVWEEMANEQTDYEAYQMYKKYSDDLKAQADILAKEGLTPGSRRAMLSMKGRYYKEITPIEQAYTTRQKYIDEQRKGAADNIYSFDASTLSLDDLIKNPSLSYKTYSGNALTKQVREAAKNLAKDLKENPRKWREILKGQYYETVMQKGFSANDIELAIANDPRAPKELTRIVEDVINSSGIRDWKDANALSRAYDYARQGLWDAVGDTTYQVQQNRGWVDPNEKPKDDPNKPTVTTNFSPRLMEGVEGEEDKSLKLLDGLRPTPTGYSTNKLDSLRRDLEETKGKLSSYSQDEISKYEAHRQRMNAATATPASGVGSYQSLAQGISTSSSTPTGYNEYTRKRADYDNALKAYNDAVTELNAIVERYSHLGATPYEQLLIGSRLDRIQQAQEKTSFALNLKESDYNNVRHGIANLIGAVDEKTINRGAVGFVDDKGKTLNYRKTQDIIDDDNIETVKIKVSGGSNPKLKIVYDGKEYTIKGVEQLDNYNRELKVVNDYLKDFSNNITSSITPIDDATYADITTKGIMNVRLSNVNSQPIPNSSFEGTTLYNPTTGEFIKVIIDREGNLIGMNTLSGELSGGTMRDNYFINMANAGLEGLVPLLAREE